MKTFTHITNKPDLPKLNKFEDGSGSRTYISPNGLKLPSVTTVLSYHKQGIIANWRARVGEAEADAILKFSATRGTKYHQMIESYLENKENLLRGLMPDMKAAFFAMQKHLDKIDNVYYIEQSLYSETLGIAGQTDLIAEFEGELAVIDHKTSSKFKRREWITNYFEQGDAYAEMLEEMTGLSPKKVVILMSSDGEPEPQIFVEPRGAHLQSLKEKIRIYKENNNVS